jgi:hypothetical protein
MKSRIFAEETELFPFFRNQFSIAIMQYSVNALHQYAFLWQKVIVYNMLTL